MAKATHDECHYRPGEGANRCGNCQHFIAPGSCSLVVNPIASNMLCDYFDKKSPGIIRG